MTFVYAPSVCKLICKCQDVEGGPSVDLVHMHTIPFENRQDQNPSGALQARFLCKLAVSNDRELLKAKQWKCCGCRKPATRISHMPISYLTSPEPVVLDMASPVCSSHVCSTMVEREGANAMREACGPVPQLNTCCLKCGKAEASKFCPRCKVAAYCTRECLKAHYREHKDVCADASTSKMAR